MSSFLPIRLALLALILFFPFGSASAQAPPPAPVMNLGNWLRHHWRRVDSE